jgi:hypothetical protein
VDLINDGLPFLSTDAARHGLSPWRLRTLVASGALRRPFRSVYVDARAPDTRLSQCQAISLVCPDGGVVGMSSATAIFDVDTYPPSRRSWRIAEFLVPHHAARQRRRGVKTIECYLPEDDIAEIHGVLVTVPGRSAIDLLRTQFRPYALASTDALHRAGLIDINDVDQRVNRLKGFPGIVQARALARMIDGRRESRGESWTFLRMVDAGFPWPEPQIPLLDRYGNELYRVDLGYRELKIGGEFNGREFHSEDDRDHDEARLADMQKRFGWRVATATFESIMGTAADFEWQLGTWLGLNPLPRSW